jgi:hypothetical protein
MANIVRFLVVFALLAFGFTALLWCYQTMPNETTVFMIIVAGTIFWVNIVRYLMDIVFPSHTPPKILPEDGTIIGNIQMVRLPSSVVGSFSPLAGFGYVIISDSCCQIAWSGFLTTYEHYGEWSIWNDEGIRVLHVKLDDLVGHVLTLACDVKRNGIHLKRGTKGTVYKVSESIYHLKIDECSYTDIFQFCVPSNPLGDDLK